MKERPHVRLRAALTAEGWSVARLAQLLEVDRSAISRWQNAASRPDAHHRIAIETLFGIPASEWLTPEERAVVAAAKRAA